MGIYLKQGSLFSAWACALLIGAVSISGCATKPTLLPTENTQQQANTSTSTNISHLTSEQRSQLFYSILLGKLAEKKQLLDIAQSNYQDALFKTNSPKLAGMSTKIALYQKDYEAAQQALSIWQDKEPDSSSPKQIALLIALHQNKMDKAFLQLQNIYPASTSDKTTTALKTSEVEQGFQELLRLAYWKSPDISDLEEQLLGIADLLNKYNLQYPSSHYADITQTTEAFLHLKSRSPLSKLARVHQLLDDVIARNPGFTGAIETKTKALALISQDKSAEFLQQILSNQALSKPQISKLANLAYRQKDFPSSIVGFKRILDAEPDNLEAQFLLAGSYYAKKDYEKAGETFHQLALEDYRKETSAFYCGDSAERVEDNVKSLICFDMVPVSQYFLEARQRMATIYANQEMYKVGAESLQRAQALVDFNQRQMLLKYEVNYLLEYEQYTLAKKRLESAIALEPHNGTIYYLQLLLADKTSDQPQFLKQVKELQERAPDLDLRKEVTFSAINLLTQKQAHETVINILDHEVQRTPNDVDLLYTRALANEPLKRYANLERDLRHLLTLDPQHLDAQNALGYTLADLNKNLDEAKRLIESAYKANPDNDAILDSMGWIQYRLGNLPEALKYIQMSYDKSQMPEIAAHLGEVLWQMGQKQQAKAIWSEALQKEPNNTYILDTLARFPEAGLLP